jgi:UDP-N-acetyl-D-glucosamine dehydrogenase
MREHKFDLSCVALDAKSLAGYDVVLLATDHDGFDYSLIGQHARLLVDTRGRYRKPQSNVVKA